jgi:hypothetical protein
MHSHSKHNKFAASHRRAAQFMKENACGGAVKKARGGSAGHPARGNNSAEAMMPKGQHQDSVSTDISTEGRSRGKRYKKGGKVQNNVVIIAHHPHHMLPAQGVTAGGPMMQAAGPMPAGAPMAGPGPGLPPPGGMPGMPPHMNQGGATTSYGAASGMSRKAEYERMRREGH